MGYSLTLSHPYFSPCRLCAHRPGGVVGPALPRQYRQPVVTERGFKPDRKHRVDAVGEGTTSTERSRTSLQCVGVVLKLKSELITSASCWCREKEVHSMKLSTDATAAT